METHFGQKMVTTNDNGFPLKGDGFPIQGGGFPLQGDFGRNLESCFQPKIRIIFEFFWKITCAGNNYIQSKFTIFFKYFCAN